MLILATDRQLSAPPWDAPVSKFAIQKTEIIVFFR
jgi:hypothetical protein